MNQTDTDTAAAAPQRDPHAFTLEQPINRGDMTISVVKLRKPNVEATRGLQLATLAQMDVDQLTKLLPRISTPALTEHDVAQLDVADLLKAGGIVLGFLFPKAAGDLQSLSA
ncbi:phage tail assembly protein [Lysobacter brunescens]|uniref:Phage tail assembly protein n=1 Tax=Lysobacter brunescens TaxID=262323 RepID=A0ABW2YGW2_9GAMM